MYSRIRGIKQHTCEAGHRNKIPMSTVCVALQAINDDRAACSMLRINISYYNSMTLYHHTAIYSALFGASLSEPRIHEV